MDDLKEIEEIICNSMSETSGLPVEKFDNAITKNINVQLAKAILKWYDKKVLEARIDSYPKDKETINTGQSKNSLAELIIEDKKVYCEECDHYDTKLTCLGGCHHPDNIEVVQEEGWIDSPCKRIWNDEKLDLRHNEAELNHNNDCVKYKERKVHWFWEDWLISDEN